MREYFNSVILWGLSWGIAKLPNLIKWNLGQGENEPSFVHKIGCISSIWRSLFCKLAFEFKRSLVVNWFAILPLFIYHLMNLKLHISSTSLKWYCSFIDWFIMWSLRKEGKFRIKQKVPITWLVFLINLIHSPLRLSSGLTVSYNKILHNQQKTHHANGNNL